MSFSSQILYVDADVDSCEMMRVWLKDFRVTIASEGNHAKELIQRKMFDLYLLDYRFPDMTAIELSEYIRAISPRVPILVYSAFSRAEDKAAVFLAGATKFLTKPNDLDKLLPEIKRRVRPWGNLSEGRGRRAASSIL